MLNFGLMISSPGSLLDLNVVEHIGSIIQDAVEKICCLKLDIIDILKTH